MAASPEPDLEEQLWTIAVARLVFGPSMSIQAPPNLRPEGLSSLVRAGINDWGGVSPVTPDHVNPEAPWPHLAGSRAQHQRGRAGSGGALGARARLCGCARALDGCRHHAARAPAQRQSRLRAAGPLVFGRERRIAADRSAAVSTPTGVRDDDRAPPLEFGDRRDPRCGERGPRIGGDRCRAPLRRRRPRSRCGHRGGRPTACGYGRRHGHLRRSIGTSTTPTSACTIAASARSRRAAAAPICAGPPISSTSTKWRVAPARRPMPVRPRCACRAASIPRFTGRHVS